MLALWPMIAYLAPAAQRIQKPWLRPSSCCSVAFVLVPRKPKSPPRQKPSSRPVSPVGRRDADLRDPRGSSYRGRDAKDPPREYDYRSRRPLSPPRRRSSPIRDPRDYRQRRPLSPPRSRRCAVLLLAPCLLSFCPFELFTGPQSSCCGCLCRETCKVAALHSILASNEGIAYYVLHGVLVIMLRPCCLAACI